MIRVSRSTEPKELTSRRTAELAKIAKLGRPPLSTEISGYAIVADLLWTDQHHKCCYCERKITLSYNDVEHYRPKGKADRAPGCTTTGGYWWLAFNWENLLVSCSTCNRSEKRVRFPLASGGETLKPGEAPPGKELPLLLDPSGKINPMEHIHFQRVRFGSSMTVYARPRNGSPLGLMTIDVCGMNRNEMRELREDHYQEVIHPFSLSLKECIEKGDAPATAGVFAAACSLFRSRCSHVALTYDLLTHEIGTMGLAKFGLSWPKIDDLIA